jgi:ribonuclease R
VFVLTDRKEWSRTIMKDLTEILADLFREQSNRPMKVKEIAKRLGIRTESYRSFRDRVRELHREGFLVKVRKGKYALKDMADLVEGKIRVRRDGSGRLLTDDKEGKTLYLSPRDRKNAIHGDYVRALVVGESRRGDRRGRVIEVLRRAHPWVAGFLDSHKGKHYVRPGNARFDKEVVVRGDMKEASEGDLVTVRVEDWGKGGHFVYGSIDRVFGDASETDADILSIILEYGLPLEFPSEVLEETDEISKCLEIEEINRRRNLRSLNAFTIDPADARDHDDAISVEKLGNDLWRVGIHIADVSHYVKIGTYLDREALTRGNSVYLVDRAIPMLPEELSAGICSLKPDEDRLTLSVLIVLDGDGTIREKEIVESVIHSRYRLTYEDAQVIIDSETEQSSDRQLFHDLKDLFRLSRALRRSRMESGSIDFDRPESYVVLNEDGLPVDIRKSLQLGSHRLIEEFMIAANEVVARHLTDGRIPMIYRVHEEPSEDDLEVLGEYLVRFGYSPLWRRSGISPKTFQAILKSVRGKKEETLITNLVLRGMKRAQYSARNIGHFGLASDLYTHFTSPIRRYSDLAIHRQLKAVLNSRELPYPAEERERLVEIASVTTERERIADLAEWTSVDLKKVQFMERHLGEVFEGTISGLVQAGFFVLLDRYFVEGMVPLRDIEDDYYDFVEEVFVIRGRRRGRIFSLGDPVNVQVARTDHLRREIDFFLVDHQPGQQE